MAKAAKQKKVPSPGSPSSGRKFIVFAAVLTFITLIALLLFLEWKTFVPSSAKNSFTLYFSDGEDRFLMGEKRQVEIIKTDRELAVKCRKIVEELIRGPRSNLTPTIPEGVRLISVQVDGAGVAHLDFSGEMVTRHPGGSSAEMMTIYSIVDSLAANLNEVRMVQFYVDGREVDTLAGHLSLVYPLAPNYDLIKQ